MGRRGSHVIGGASRFGGGVGGVHGGIGVASKVCKRNGGGVGGADGTCGGGNGEIRRAGGSKSVWGNQGG